MLEIGWNPAHPWLNGDLHPRIFGPCQSISRDCLIEEYMVETSAAGMVASVHCQANWPADKAVEEVRGRVR